VCIRKLGQEDLAIFREHLLSLDKDDRYMRFEGFVCDETIIAYAADSLSSPSTVVFGAFVDGALRGVGEIHAPGPFCEIALSVDKRYRLNGLGGSLLSASLKGAAAMGWENVSLQCLSSNSAVKTLVKRFGATLQYSGADLVGSIPTKGA